MDRDDSQVPEELREAIETASRYLGIAEGAPGDGAKAPTAPPFLVQYDSSVRRWIWPLLLVVALALTLGGAGYLLLRVRPPLPPHEEEVDLRWAVAHVVRQVETFRGEHGRLPAARDLYGLLSEAVSYEVVGNHYQVVGDWGGVRVEYDGSVPLDVWVKQTTYPATDTPR